MNEAAPALNVSTRIVKSSPAGVASLFNRYGIKAPPTGKNLFLAMIKHKGQFVNDLYDSVSFSNATGTDQAEKGKFFELMNNILSTASNTMDLLERSKNNPQNTTAPALLPGNAPGQTPAGSNNKMLIYAGIALIVILVLIVILKKK